MRLFAPDGNYYLHRAWFTLNPKPDWSDQKYADAMSWRLLSMVCADAVEVRATHVCVAFDGGQVFRYNVYPEYKANRNKSGNTVRDRGADGIPDKDMYEFLKPCMALLKRAGIKVYQFAEYEADDVLASLAQLPTNVILGTRDKDLFQVLKPNVQMFYWDPYTKKPSYITHITAEQKLGVRIDQMIEYQMLLGDSADNIPQAKFRLGPKTAVKILNEHGTISNFYKKAPLKDKKWLVEAQSLLKTNRKLVTLVTDVVRPKPSELLVRKRPGKWPTSYNQLVSGSSDFLRTRRRASIGSLTRAKF